MAEQIIILRLFFMAFLKEVFVLFSLPRLNFNGFILRNRVEIYIYYMASVFSQ